MKTSRSSMMDSLAPGKSMIASSPHSLSMAFSSWIGFFTLTLSSISEADSLENCAISTSGPSSGHSATPETVAAASTAPASVPLGSAPEEAATAAPTSSPAPRADLAAIPSNIPAASRRRVTSVGRSPSRNCCTPSNAAWSIAACHTAPGGIPTVLPASAWRAAYTLVTAVAKASLMPSAGRLPVAWLVRVLSLHGRHDVLAAAPGGAVSVEVDLPGLEVRLSGSMPQPLPPAALPSRPVMDALAPSLRVSTRSTALPLSRPSSNTSTLPAMPAASATWMSLARAARAAATVLAPVELWATSASATALASSRLKPPSAGSCTLHCLMGGRTRSFTSKVRAPSGCRAFMQRFPLGKTSLRKLGALLGPGGEVIGRTVRKRPEAHSRSQSSSI
mmetsp:Transcript_21228/g.58980  ORF Transcript_21228/g.58980 Transcript_21228/m.58980 type:complete len:391 (+) Transcript_21228:2359-3531(+)